MPDADRACLEVQNIGAADFLGTYTLSLVKKIKALDLNIFSRIGKAKLE